MTLICKYNIVKSLLSRVRVNVVLRHFSGVITMASQTRRRVERLAPENRLVWVDLEMTGLDIETDQILEMACVITDADLNVLKEGPTVVIHHSDEVLKSMNAWCQEHHKKSGLIAAVQESTMTLEEAQDQMIKFVREFTPQGKCPLAGNSVHVDKMFLNKYMRPFVEHLHYRIVDVSTIKEICRRWYSEVFYNAPAKSGAHRANTDIHQSIKELKYYRQHVFVKV